MIAQNPFGKLLTPARAARMARLCTEPWFLIPLGIGAQMLAHYVISRSGLSAAWPVARGLGIGVGAALFLTLFIFVHRWVTSRCGAMVAAGALASTAAGSRYLVLDQATRPANDTLTAAWKCEGAVITAGRSWLSIKTYDGKTLRLRGQDYWRFAALVRHHLTQTQGQVKSRLGGRWLQLSAARGEEGRALDIEGHRASVIDRGVLDDLCDWLATNKTSDEIRAAALDLAAFDANGRMTGLHKQLEAALAGVEQTRTYSAATVTTTCTPGGIMLGFGSRAPVKMTRTSLSAIIACMHEAAPGLAGAR